MNVHQAMTQPAAWQSCFILPRLEPTIPVRLSTDGSMGRTLARLVQLACDAGVPVPKGNGFESIEQVLQAQWQSYLESAMPDVQHLQLLAGEPKIRVFDRRLEFAMEATSRLNVFQLKPVITDLERAKAGLGWYVAKVLSHGHAHGHAFYDMAVAANGLPYQFQELDSFTDEAFARYLIQYEEGEDDAEEISAERMEQLRQHYTFWPSEISAALDGNTHLLDGPYYDASWPALLKRAEAKKWLQRHPNHTRAQVVACALALDEACELDRDHAFVYSWASLAQTHDEEVDDGEEAIGAAAFVAWDDPSMLIELVEHHEQYILNGQGGTDYARCWIPLGRPDQDELMYRLVTATAAYFRRWGLVARLLSHFPIWEDET